MYIYTHTLKSVNMNGAIKCKLITVSLSFAMYAVRNLVPLE